MTIILAILMFVPRPAVEPVTAGDVARVFELERRPTAAAVLPDAETQWHDRVSGRFVVGFTPGSREEARDWVEANGGQVVRVDDGGRFLVAGMPDEACELLGRRARSVPGIRWFEPDARVRASHVPNDPGFLAEQWGKWVMYADKAWDVSLGSSTVTVAVADNGVEYLHPDLVARYVPGEYGYDFVDNDDDPRPDNIGLDEAFHGTHVSGIVAATMDNGVGVAGWGAIRLLAVKVLNDSGSGVMSDLASGIRWATDHGADVINMSLGSDDHTSSVAEACRYAESNGVLLVAAAGNQGAGVVQYPARYDECVCVGALGKSGMRAEYSNYGEEQEVVAPGSYIYSTWVGGTYGSASGTSMASPQVAGVAGLVKSVDNTLSASRVRAILSVSAIDMGAPGFETSFGNGLVNAYRAAQLAQVMARGAGGPIRESVAGGRIVRGGLALPGWVERASVFDASGRAHRRVSTAGRVLRLEPGTWFLRFEGAGRDEFVRVLAVR